MLRRTLLHSQTSKYQEGPVNDVRTCFDPLGPTRQNTRCLFLQHFRRSILLGLICDPSGSESCLAIESYHEAIGQEKPSC